MVELLRDLWSILLSIAVFLSNEVPVLSGLRLLPRRRCTPVRFRLFAASTKNNISILPLSEAWRNHQRQLNQE
jgi:hypothetical protein